MKRRRRFTEREVGRDLNTQCERGDFFYFVLWKGDRQLKTVSLKLLIAEKKILVKASASTKLKIADHVYIYFKWHEAKDFSAP